MNRGLPDVQIEFRKGRGTRDQTANIHWIIKKQENSRKTCTSASLAMLKLLTVWITTDCGKFFKRWEYQTALSASWEICMQVKKQQLELDMEQWTDSKLGKGICQGCILSPCLFNFFSKYVMWNAGLDEAQAGIRIARRNTNNLTSADDTTLMAEREEKLKSFLLKVKAENSNDNPICETAKETELPRAESFWKTGGQHFSPSEDILYEYTEALYTECIPHNCIHLTC